MSLSSDFAFTPHENAHIDPLFGRHVVDRGSKLLATTHLGAIMLAFVEAARLKKSGNLYLIHELTEQQLEGFYPSYKERHALTSALVDAVMAADVLDEQAAFVAQASTRGSVQGHCQDAGLTVEMAEAI